MSPPLEQAPSPRVGPPPGKGRHVSGHQSLVRPEGTGKQPHDQDLDVPVSWDFLSVPWGHGPHRMVWGLVSMKQEFSGSATLHPQFRVRGG